jgi:hypothetical protein
VTRALGALLLFVLGPGASGCYVTESYRVSPRQLAQVAALPEAERAITAVPVTRVENGRPVWVRADALTPLPATGPQPDRQTDRQADQQTNPQASPETNGPVQVRSRRYSPMVTAAVILTGIGTVASIAGTIGFFVGKDSVSTAFGILALSAEPPMMIGTVLWPIGIVRAPQRVKPGDPSLRYLDPPAAPITAPTTAPIAAPIATP